MMRYLSLAVLILAAFFVRGYLGGLFTHPYGSHQNPAIPSDFPNDVPVYPNHHLDDARKIAGAFELELTAKSDAQTVLAFYQHQLPAYGLHGTATPNRDPTHS